MNWSSKLCVWFISWNPQLRLPIKYSALRGVGAAKVWYQVLRSSPTPSCLLDTAIFDRHGQQSTKRLTFVWELSLGMWQPRVTVIVVVLVIKSRSRGYRIPLVSILYWMEGENVCGWSVIVNRVETLKSQMKQQTFKVFMRDGEMEDWAINSQVPQPLLFSRVESFGKPAKVIIDRWVVNFQQQPLVELVKRQMNSADMWHNQ